MLVESEKSWQGSIRDLFLKSQGPYAETLNGKIVKTVLGDSHYLVVGVSDTGPELDRGLKACPLDNETPDAPHEVVIPWSTRVSLLSEIESHALLARTGKKISRLKEKYKTP